MDHNDGETRQSLVQRASNAVRSTVESVGEKIEQGTMAGAMLNTLCNVIGAGVLSMAFAMYNASMGIGIILLIYSTICSGISSYFMAKSCDYTGFYSMTQILAFSIYPRLTRTEYRRKVAEQNGTASGLNNAPADDECLDDYEADELKKAKRRDYIEIFMNVMTFFYNYGTLIVYGRVIADSIPPVVADFLHGSGFWVQRYAWLLMGGVVFFILSCARHMEELKWTSLMGFITILYIIILVFVRYFTNEEHAMYPEQKVEVEYWHFTMQSFNAITTYGLAFCYHYNVPYYYRELKDRTPKRFMITVAVCLPITAISYATVGICGYLTFGAMVASSKAGGNIVNNYPDDDTAVNVGRLGLFFHFVAVYPLLAVSCRRNLHRLLFRFFFDKRDPDERLGLLSDQMAEDEGLNDPAENPTRPQIIAEAFVIVTSTAVISYFVPGVGIVIEVSGCLFGVFLMFLVPAIVGIRIHGEKFVPKCIKDAGDEQTDRFADPNRSRFRNLAIFQLISGIFFYVASITSLTYGFIVGDGTS